VFDKRRFAAIQVKGWTAPPGGHVLIAARLNDGETVEEALKVAGVVARHG
jgi:hypothetical protein